MNPVPHEDEGDLRVLHLRFSHVDAPVALVVRDGVRLPGFLFGVHGCRQCLEKQIQCGNDNDGDAFDPDMREVRSGIVSVTDMGRRPGLDLGLVSLFHSMLLDMFLPDIDWSTYDSAGLNYWLAPAARDGVDLNFMKTATSYVESGWKNPTLKEDYHARAISIAEAGLAISRGRCYYVLRVGNPASTYTVTDKKGLQVSLCEYHESVGQHVTCAAQPVLECVSVSFRENEYCHEHMIQHLKIETSSDNCDFNRQCKYQVAYLLPEHTAPHCFAAAPPAWKQALPLIPKLLHVLEEQVFGTAAIATKICRSIFSGAEDIHDNDQLLTPSSSFVCIADFLKVRRSRLASGSFDSPERDPSLLASPGLFDESQAIIKVLSLCQSHPKRNDCFHEIISSRDSSTVDNTTSSDQSPVGDILRQVHHLSAFSFNSSHRRRCDGYTNFFYGVHTAVTTAGAKDPEFVNERLEWLGDAVLAFLSAVHSLYSHEGRQAASRIEANDRRNRLAANAHLAYCITSHFPELVQNLRSRRISSKVGKSLPKPAPFPRQEAAQGSSKVSEKQIASVGEAMIGLLALQGGLPAAHQLLQRSFLWSDAADTTVQINRKQLEKSETELPTDVQLHSTELKEYIGSAAFSLYISCLVYEQNPDSRERVLHASRLAIWKRRHSLADMFRRDHVLRSVGCFDDAATSDMMTTDTTFYKMFVMARERFSSIEAHIRERILTHASCI